CPAWTPTSRRASLAAPLTRRDTRASASPNSMASEPTSLTLRRPAILDGVGDRRTLRVLVVQHGEKERRPGDPGLTSRGRDQARRTATWLRTTAGPVGAVWSSPLRRAGE